MHQENGLPKNQWTRIPNPSGLSIDKVFRETVADLNVNIDNEERAQIAAEMCEHYLYAEKLEKEKKDFMDEWKARKANNEEKLGKLVDSLMSGRAKKTVDCREVFDHTAQQFYFEYRGDKYCERTMRNHEYLIGQPELFDDPMSSEETQQERGDVSEAVLVASTDGTTTKVAKRLKKEITLTPIRNDISDVMREEMNARTKHDTLTN